VTQCAGDAADPDFPGARAYAKAHGLPYIRGGLMELGGSQDPISEAQSYQPLLGFVRSARPFGTSSSSSCAPRCCAAGWSAAHSSVMTCPT
jgi:gluconate 2-dehydrogenase alpha chain